jgi:MFS family permease
MTCIVIFTISSFLCGIAPSLPILLICRVFQGIGGGGLQPMAQAIMADSFEPKKRGQAFALYGLVAVLAPSVGPTIGGWITDNYSWRWIFYINIPVGVLALVLVSRLVQDPPWIKADRRNLFKLDYIGLGLLTVAMGGLLVTNRSLFHQARLVDAMQPGNPQYMQQTRAIGSYLAGSGMGSISQGVAAARAMIYGQLNQQASAMGYQDVYRMLCWMSVIMVGFAFLLSKNRPGEGAPAGEAAH